jgi:hypothetical protein
MAFPTGRIKIKGQALALIGLRVGNDTVSYAYGWVNGFSKADFVPNLRQCPTFCWLAVPVESTLFRTSLILGINSSQTDKFGKTALQSNGKDRYQHLITQTCGVVQREGGGGGGGGGI